mmetsp:Transcript_18500/g.46359  ORF Transcript_18500/g.46359 Transcript_18500/m.46359 type:complete len:103 (-) Transcript_18500:187-495(-)|eukprot:CAMPEP_0182827234 /NCGR_PEP_ID=MMETSP0006_2-20121128/16811_1 /TAXON_ID=97485 /ORGANISM="Prymnesium parvum, Strain Texoma1" /LENGTH=102 /DNA_ID=CAMNT_0024954477 /DNA_START=243 /DNA_END=551 /DNA_ORIENTATION=+
MAALEHAVSHKKEAAAIKSEVKYAPRIGAFEFILALSMQNLGKKAHARCIDSFPRLQQSPCWRVGFLLNGSGSAALGTTSGSTVAAGATGRCQRDSIVWRFQ